MKWIVAAACLAFAGCFTPEINVESTSPWEGHYYSFEMLRVKISDQKLEDDQSIWLLSNTTLKRLLKDAGEK